MLNIAHAGVTVGTNGPGRRFTVWAQGCDRRCSGCFNPELQPREIRRSVSAETLAAEALSNGPLEGVSLSGGEPFAQAEELSEFLDALREGTPDLQMPALAFTGYSVEELRAGEPAWAGLLSRLDLLVDGPYREDEPSTQPLLGSANQRLLALSSAGEELLRRIEREPPGRFAVSVADDGEVIIMGFPPGPVLRALRLGLGG